MSEERKQILEMLAGGKITIDEAESLLNALGEGKPEVDNSEKIEKPQPEKKKSPKFLHVLVEPKNGGKDSVNIKIPLNIIRAGVKLKSILPDSAKTKFNTVLGKKGFNLNIDDINTETVDELLPSLAEFGIEVDDEDEKVRIYCE